MIIKPYSTATKAIACSHSLVQSSKESKSFLVFCIKKYISRIIIFDAKSGFYFRKMFFILRPFEPFEFFEKKNY